MMMPWEHFTLGQVVVSDGPRDSFISREVSRVTRSPRTHAFIITGPDRITEAWVPRVREYSLSERLSQLHREGRGYAVLDAPWLEARNRRWIADKARSYEGRWYDLGQIALFYLTRRFWNDGDGTLVCSRLVTASYWHGGGFHLFPDWHLRKLQRDPNIDQRALAARWSNLRQGYATPADLEWSQLEAVYSWEPHPAMEELFV
jgi:hypothetical protein